MSYFNAPTGAPDMPGAIAQAVIDVMGAVGRLRKEGHNSHDGYKYVSIDGIMEAVNPACAAAGLIIKPVVIKTERFEAAGKTGVRRMLRMFFKFRLIHKSGATWIDDDDVREVEVQATGAQAFGSGEAYAFKQFARTLFQIPTGEEDADAGEQLDTEVRRAKVRAAVAERETGDEHFPFDFGDGIVPVALSDIAELCRAHMTALNSAAEVKAWVERNKHGRAQLHAAHPGLAMGLKKEVEAIVASFKKLPAAPAPAPEAPSLERPAQQPADEVSVPVAQVEPDDRDTIARDIEQTLRQQGNVTRLSEAWRLAERDFRRLDDERQARVRMTYASCRDKLAKRAQVSA
jgi:hypothetical protein